MKIVPINTKKETNTEPLGMFLTARILGASGAIEQQEAEGQASFVESTTLPTEMGKDDKKFLESWGCVFGEEVEGDPLFQYVTLPEGWKKQGTDHSMHSELIDDKGRKRAGIFYKAAFYDRRADLHLCRRYGYQSDYERADNEGVAVSQVTDCGEVIHETEPLKMNMDKDAWKEQSEARDEAGKMAKAWLDERYPKWQSAATYWD